MSFAEFAQMTPVQRAAHLAERRAARPAAGPEILARINGWYREAGMHATVTAMGAQEAEELAAELGV